MSTTLCGTSSTTSQRRSEAAASEASLDASADGPCARLGILSGNQYEQTTEEGSVASETPRGMRHIATATVQRVARLPDGNWLVTDVTDHYRFTMRIVEYDLKPGDSIDLYGNDTYSLFGQHIIGVRINGGPFIEASA